MKILTEALKWIALICIVFAGCIVLGYLSEKEHKEYCEIHYKNDKSNPKETK